MATNPFYSPKFRAFDANGNPLSGGLLYTYAAGTTTPEATYTTRGGTIANANPVVLDANGEADVWMTPGVDYKFELRNSVGVVQWTVDNVPSAGESETDTSYDVTIDPGGRLSVSSGVAVTTSSVTGATTIYYVPYRHNKVPLYDGTSWAAHTFPTQLSQTTSDSTKSPTAVANLSAYDVFIWDDSGTLRLSRGPAWASDHARGTGAGTTELERIDGRWVNKVSISNGPAAQCGLYVGTIYSDGSAQLNDSMAKRHVWNMHHRIAKSMRVTESTDSWTYDSMTIRLANGSAANILDMVIGIEEDEVSAQVNAFAGCIDFLPVYVGVGLDSNTAFASGFISTGVNTVDAPGIFRVFSSLGGSWRGFPGIGRRYLSWLERGADGVTGITWYGDAGAPGWVQAGISGRVFA